MQYRISKFNPIYRNEKGEYTLEEWTSISDIGKCYNGVKFTLNEYLHVEETYLSIYLDVVVRLNIDKVKVIDLDKQMTLSEATKILNRYDIVLDNVEKRVYQKLKSEQMIPIKYFEFIFRLAMREIIWCKITDPFFDISIEFGYDYYTYLIGFELENDLIEKYKSLGIFIERLDE